MLFEFLPLVKRGRNAEYLTADIVVWVYIPYIKPYMTPWGTGSLVRGEVEIVFSGLRLAVRTVRRDWGQLFSNDQNNTLSM